MHLQVFFLDIYFLIFKIEAFNILTISIPLCLKKFLSSADTKANLTFLGIFSIGTKILFE